MVSKADSIALSLDQLRAIGTWAADCAERALSVYEGRVESDPRPRAAIEGIRIFAAGERRTAALRRLAMAALAAARVAADPAATAAATAACLAASSAYTHPLADVAQTKHIVGPAAYAALALELDSAGDQKIAHDEIRRAIDRAPPEVREVLLQMPPRSAGKGKANELMFELDKGIRGRGANEGGFWP